MAENNNNFAMLSLVGIVAVVGIVGLIFMNSGNAGTTVVPSSSEATPTQDKEGYNVAGNAHYAACDFGRVGYYTCASIGASDAGDCCAKTAEGLMPMME
ncbi:MAG: hypothetical protein ACLFO2_00180 [Candidatus Woesearchaeota archaeon]